MFTSSSSSFPSYSDREPRFQKAANSQTASITVYTAEGPEEILQTQIAYLIADGSYTRIILRDGTRRMFSRRLGTMEKLLVLEHFVRIHRSYLINLQYLERYLNQDGGCVVMRDGFSLPLSKSRKSQFFERLKGWL